MPIPPERIRRANVHPTRSDGDFVLYWCIAARRTGWSWALQRASEEAARLDRPLLVLEALRCDHPWASHRFHRFVLQGMADNVAASPVTWYPYVEPTPGAGKGLLEALASRACLIVTDEYPTYFLPSMVSAAARLPVALEIVDGLGVLPLSATPSAFPTAHSFRRFLHKALPEHLDRWPAAEPLALAPTRRIDMPVEVQRRWPAAPLVEEGWPDWLGALPIDQEVEPVALRGGARAGSERLARFVDGRLARYADGRNQPDDEVTTGLSPWLHWGHVGAQQVLHAVLDRARWSPDRLAPKPTGARRGWWGLDEASEAFVDQLVTWRELGTVHCFHRIDHRRYSSLPEWARRTLAEHADDPRPGRYSLDQLESASTDDPIWNAAQRQLRREGVVHNYLRMLWGKRVLEWSDSPEQAWERLVHLNDRWALDGRDPNSWTGISWCLGQFDRAWGPERPVFGKVRYMSSANTARKLRLGGYLERFGA